MTLAMITDRIPVVIHMMLIQSSVEVQRGSARGMVVLTREVGFYPFLEALTAPISVNWKTLVLLLAPVQL